MKRGLGCRLVLVTGLNVHPTNVSASNDLLRVEKLISMIIHSKFLVSFLWLREICALKEQDDVIQTKRFDFRLFF